MPESDVTPPPGSYWPGMHGDAPDAAADVLTAVREFRRIDAAMRRRTQAALEINGTDLLALRHLISAERAGESIGPTDLSVLLGISSAATAKLLSRLDRTGHIRREPHALDRRAQVVHATPQAHQEVRRALGPVHQRMIDVADELSVTDRRAVIRFLRAMGAAMSDEESTLSPSSLLSPSSPSSPSLPSLPSLPSAPAAADSSGLHRLR